jgi:cell division protease FtsH
MGIWRFIARWLAIPPYLFLWLKRHKTIRKVLLIIVLILFGLSRLGPDTLMMALQLGAQMIFGFFFMIVQFGGMMWFMSQTKTIIVHPGDEGAITWDDYWGNDPVRQNLQEWTALLTDKKEFLEMGGTIPRGILLVGPPGTGKTWAAKALAGSAGVPFRGIEGSGFRGMFWGMDVLRMIQFISGAIKMARESIHNASIAYIDELEAIGARRGGRGGEGQQAAGGLMGGMMTSGALTRLLVMMDGMEDVGLYIQIQNKILKFVEAPLIEIPTVLFLGSTNRPQDLDPALIRSGRFGVRIIVDPPDRGSRRALFTGYLAKIKHDGKIDIDALVQDTAGRTPADIAGAVTAISVRIAHFDSRKEVTQLDLEDALQEQLAGIKNPISDLEPEQKEVFAIHEAGHAVTQHYLREDQRIVRVSIQRRSRMMGYMLPAAKYDQYAKPLEIFVNAIKVSLSGHLAVELVKGALWTGASSDFQHVRNNLEALRSFGYFDEFPIQEVAAITGPKRPEGEDKKVQEFMKQTMQETRDFLVEHRDELDALWQALVEKEDLTGREAVRIIEEAASG